MQALRVVVPIAAAIWWVVVGVRYCIGAPVPTWLIAFALFTCGFHSIMTALRAAAGR